LVSRTFFPFPFLFFSPFSSPSPYFFLPYSSEGSEGGAQFDVSLLLSPPLSFPLSSSSLLFPKRKSHSPLSSFLFFFFPFFLPFHFESMGVRRELSFLPFSSQKFKYRESRRYFISLLLLLFSFFFLIYSLKGK